MWTACLCAVSCVLAYSLFRNVQFTLLGEEGAATVIPIDPNHHILLWHGLMSWTVVMLSLIFVQCTMEYTSDYKEVEELEEQQFARINQLINTWWKTYDINGDGKLSKYEAREFIMKQVLREGEDMNNDAYEIIFNQFDTNKNGFIELEEMRKFVDHLYGKSVEYAVDADEE